MRCARLPAQQPRAYCPYSHLQVGAAALVDDGRVDHRLQRRERLLRAGLCAPSARWSGSSRLTGGGRLVALACRSGTGELLMPCGRCRQVIYEFGGPRPAGGHPDRAADR